MGESSYAFKKPLDAPNWLYLPPQRTKYYNFWYRIETINKTKSVAIAAIASTANVNGEIGRIAQKCGGEECEGGKVEIEACASSRAS